jgi:hypothetical protein
MTMQVQEMFTGRLLGHAMRPALAEQLLRHGACASLLGRSGRQHPRLQQPAVLRRGSHRVPVRGGGIDRDARGDDGRGLALRVRACGLLVGGAGAHVGEHAGNKTQEPALVAGRKENAVLETVLRGPRASRRSWGRTRWRPRSLPRAEESAESR